MRSFMGRYRVLRVNALQPIRRIIGALALIGVLSFGGAGVRGDGAVAQSADAVDLALILAIDCSYSVDQREYKLQITGTAQAFRRPEIVAAIQSGAYRRIAVSIIQWSDLAHQAIVVPWQIISDAESAARLADMIENLPRSLAEGGTSITAAMGFSANMLRTAPFQADRLVMDIAADGRNNNGGDPRPMRDAIVAQGITINGLSILNEVPTLDKYFKLYITGGPANFVMPANDYAAYSVAIYRKLLREIIGPRLS